MRHLSVTVTLRERFERGLRSKKSLTNKLRVIMQKHFLELSENRTSCFLLIGIVKPS